MATNLDSTDLEARSDIHRYILIKKVANKINFYACEQSFAISGDFGFKGCIPDDDGDGIEWAIGSGP